MRASATAVGGTLIVDSVPGSGTTVTATLRPGGVHAAEQAPAPVRTLRVVRNEPD
jgi:hypothetical protein